MLIEIPWQEQISYPALTLLQLLPLITAVVIVYFKHRLLTRVLSMLTATIELIISFHLYANYNTENGAMQFAENIQVWGLSYHVAIDGISLLFMILASLLTLLALVYALIRKLNGYASMFAVFMLTLSSMMSLLVTLNLLWFTFVSALQIIPIAYLINRWSSSPAKEVALVLYIQFMLVSVAMLFAGVIMLAWNYSDVTGLPFSFDFFDLIQVQPSTKMGTVTFFLLFYAFAIRTPLFPLHGWLPSLMEHGSIAVAPVFLLGLKMGLYGLLRFVFPLFTEIIQQWQLYIVAFAVTGIFYAAILALRQHNLRRLLAFAILSHTSVLVIGLFTLDAAAFQGAIMMSVNYGIAIAGLLFMIGTVFRHTKTMLLSRLGGLFPKVPLIGITFFVAGLAIASMPGTPGFDAAHLMLEDAMHRFGAVITIAAALGNVVAAAFLLLAFQRAFLSPIEGIAVKNMGIVSWQERALAVLILVIILVVGFHSEPWLRLIETPVNQLSLLFH